MTALANPSQRSAASDGVPAEQRVRAQVWKLLAALYPHNGVRERRRQRRYPYPYLICLTPLADDGATPEGEPIVVVGKHLCEQGLGFYHPKPIPHRRVLASLETAAGGRIEFVLDLTWCRFTAQGWYESGGRFLQIAQPG
jgi:hypothetical protein